MSDKAKKRPAPKRAPKQAEPPAESATPIIPIRNSGLAEAIKQTGEIYQMMVDSVRDYAIFMLDPDGHVASWNKGASGSRAIRRPRSLASTSLCFIRSQTLLRQAAVRAEDGRPASEGSRTRAGASERMVPRSGQT